MAKFRSRLGVLLLLVGGLPVLGIWIYWKWEGRLESSQDTRILKAAERYGVPPELVKAVVWRESHFNVLARGGAGELGLMQLREDAAREWADTERLDAFDHEHCLDPMTNLLAGTYYLGKLLLRFRNADDPRAYALAAYNAGRSNALKWNTGAAATNSSVFLEQIGFPSTRAYVVTVLERTARYQRDFPKQR